MRALVIVGHGSHLNPTSSAPVYDHADAIRRLGVFDEVRECFWKEEPSMRQILDLVESEEVFVVPLFVSEGYFTEEVIPRELRLGGPAPSVTTLDGRIVRYRPPIGTHEWMARMILRRAEQTAGLSDEAAGRAALIVIGHGTERNPKSSQVIHDVTAQLEGMDIFRTVRAGFLDQPPEIGEVLSGVEEETVVLVPFFVAEGWHTQETIPDDLGLRRPEVSEVTRRDDRTFFYTPPVGTFPEVAEIIVQRCREAGAVIADATEAIHV